MLPILILSGHLDFDLSKRSLDERMAHRAEPQPQRRGRYRRDDAGTTQRDHLMQED